MDGRWRNKEIKEQKKGKEFRRNENNNLCDPLRKGGVLKDGITSVGVLGRRDGEGLRLGTIDCHVPRSGKFKAVAAY